MYRAVVYLALAIATICTLGLIVPQSISYLTFILPSGVFAVINLVLALILLHFGVAAYFRKTHFKLAFGIFGAFWVLLATISIAAPTIFGLIPHYMRTADVVTILVIGLAFLIAALEFERLSLVEEFGLRRFRYIWRELIHSQRQIEAKTHRRQTQ